MRLGCNNTKSAKLRAIQTVDMAVEAKNNKNNWIAYDQRHLELN